MKIQITTEDFRNAISYTDPTHCPLVQAIKRQVEADLILCSIGEVLIKKGNTATHYSVTWDWRSDQQLYGGEYEGMSIDEMIDLAKMNPNIEFPTIELELK
jgi:hypothetical protein